MPDPLTGPPVPPAALTRDAAQLRVAVDQLFNRISPHLDEENPDPYAALLWTAATVAGAAVTAVEATDPRSGQPVWLLEVAVSLLRCTHALHELGEQFMPPTADIADGVPIRGSADYTFACTRCGRPIGADQGRYAYGPPATSLPRPVCSIRCARAVHGGEAPDERVGRSNSIL